MLLIKASWTNANWTFFKLLIFGGKEGIVLFIIKKTYLGDFLDVSSLMLIRIGLPDTDNNSDSDLQLNFNADSDPACIKLQLDIFYMKSLSTVPVPIATNDHSWAQRKLSPLNPLNILLSINGPLLS